MVLLDEPALVIVDRSSRPRKPTPRGSPPTPKLAARSTNPTGTYA
jgi:hypothetical protein